MDFSSTISFSWLYWNLTKQRVCLIFLGDLWWFTETSSKPNVSGLSPLPLGLTVYAGMNAENAAVEGRAGSYLIVAVLWFLLFVVQAKREGVSKSEVQNAGRGWFRGWFGYGRQTADKELTVGGLSLCVLLLSGNPFCLH